MNVLILDTECTGTDHSKDKAIEIGVILFSLKHVAPIASYSSLIRADGQPAEAERVNRIPSALLPHAPEAVNVWDRVRPYAAASKAILAHNASFDEGMVPEDLRKVRPWVCTQDDIEWPCYSSSKSLIGLTLAHGIGVARAHRALADCEMIAALLERCHELGHDIVAMLRRGLRPKGRFEAIVSRENNQIAKDAGFRADYSSGRFGGWVRTMAIEDVDKLPFKVRRIDTPEPGTENGGPLFDDAMAPVAAAS